MSEDNRWFVVIATVKGEEKAERDLHHLGFQTYAPTGKIERFSKRKKVFRTHEYRMMPRYLFVRAAATDAMAIKECRGVYGIVSIEGRPIPLDKEGEKALLMMMAAERNLEFDQTRAGKLHRREIGRTKKETTKLRFPPGAHVLIKQGPFASFAAEVVSVNGRGAIEAMVKVFGRLSSTEIPTEWVEIVDIPRQAA